MVDSFLQFIRNDQVGRICNFHLAIADAARPQFANDDRCKALATLNSIAVDFGKTGIPVGTKAVNNALGDVVFPDFMDGHRISDTVIGRIYRDAKTRNEGERVNTAHARLEVIDVWTAVPGTGNLKMLKWAEEKLKEWTVEFSDMMSSCALPLRLCLTQICTYFSFFPPFSFFLFLMS
jgi:hypothetical protein